MAEALLGVALFITVTKAALVVDAVFLSAGRGLVAHAAENIRSLTSLPASRSAASPRQQPRRQPTRGPAGAGSSKARSLHVKLLLVHAMAIIGQAAATLKYALRVTVANCTVTHRFLVAFTILYDSSLVTFLLAKVHVTNGSRTLAGWEKAVIWLSRVYAWVYLPLVAAGVGFTYEGGTNEEGTFCHNGSGGDQAANNAIGYASNNVSLIFQFVLLLVLFVKPLLVQQGGTQSGGAFYRRVVIRNLVCTALVCTSYLITTVVMVLALLKETPDDNTASQVADEVPMINMLITLCLTEITLPLGFTSCIKACSVGSVVKNQAGADVVKGTTATAGTATAGNNVVAQRSTAATGAGTVTGPTTVVPLETLTP